MRFLIITTIIMCLPSVIASSAKGVVTEIRASNSADQIIFKIDGEIKDSPRCNESQTYTFSIINEGGRAILELVKISFLEGIPIAVAGLNSCSSGWSSEGVQDVLLFKPTT